MGNTLDKGIYRWIIFRRGQEWVGVVLEFNIVEVGDDPRVVFHNIEEAALGYVENARKMRKGFRPETLIPMLNQESESEFETLWQNATKAKEEKVPFPEEVFDVGSRNLAYA